jgi:hypothetical protein
MHATVWEPSSGPPTAGSGPDEKIFGLPSKGGPAQNIYVKLKDLKCSLSGGKNDHNALWHWRNSYNAKCVVAVFKQPQRVVACEDMP